MVMIPTDAGVRLRTQTETLLPQVAPPPDVALDLSDLPPGKAFTAQIQEVLPENTYKALVAGRQLTLALPQGARMGDVLELVVVDRSPRVVVAQLANPAATGESGATGQPYEFTNLSKAAQLIGTLLARDGQSPPSVALTRGQPLLPQAPTDSRQLAAELVPQLAKAVSQSGLFYEAHQAQWISGKRPLADLMTEPQAKFSALALPDVDAAPERAAATRGGESGARASGPLALLQSLLGIESAAKPESGSQPLSAGQAGPLSLGVPEELRPIIQQQLDAAATQRLAWHGDIWPQQAMQWEIERDGGSRTGSEAEEGRTWTSALTLTTPRLGEIEARLQLSQQGVRITIATASADSAGDLRLGIVALDDALKAAGLRLLTMNITST